MGIRPDSYSKRGITNNKAANQVLNADFTVKKISATPSFTDSCESIIKNNGLSIPEFKSASMLSYDELEKLGKLDAVKAVRNAIPDPASDTVMQKIINPEYVESYFKQGQYSASVSGSVAKLSDTQHLKTYKELYNGLRLDYQGTPFVNPYSGGEKTMYAIRFTTNDASENIVKSVRSVDLDNAGWASPYTGTGFISSADELKLTQGIYPGTVTAEGTQIIPEYFAKSAEFADGAEMYIITESGEEILYAVFNEIDGYFKLIGE